MSFPVPLLQNMCSYCTLACKVKRKQSEEGLGGADGNGCERWCFQFVTGHRYRTSWRLSRGCSCRRKLIYFSNLPVGCATVNCKHMWAATCLQSQMYFQCHCQIILINSRFYIFYESILWLMSWIYCYICDSNPAFLLSWEFGLSCYIIYRGNLHFFAFCKTLWITTVFGRYANKLRLTLRAVDQQTVMGRQLNSACYE